MVNDFARIVRTYFKHGFEHVIHVRLVFSVTVRIFEIYIYILFTSLFVTTKISSSILSEKLFIFFYGFLRAFRQKFDTDIFKNVLSCITIFYFYFFSTEKRYVHIIIILRNIFAIQRRHKIKKSCPILL